MRADVDAVAANDWENDWVNKWVQKGRKKFEAVSTEDSASAARTTTSLSTYEKTPAALKLIDAVRGSHCRQRRLAWRRGLTHLSLC